ncbi:MAG: AEC family transporter [Myxococcales bacterium]|nr:AEC family transporter [Myxococcales bacterium]
MTTFFLTAALLAIGVFLRHLRALPHDADRTLSGFVIYVSLPALVLARVPDLQLSGAVWAPLVLPWFMVAISVPMVFALAKVFRWSREVTGAMLLVVPLGNTSFLGIPMVEAMFGPVGVPWALLYDQLGSFLALSIWGAFVVARWSGKPAPSIGHTALQIVRFPPFIALLLAVISRWLPRPDAWVAVLEAVASSLVPVVMVAVGLQLRLRLPKSDFVPFFTGLTVKLAVAPLIGWLLCEAVGWEGLPTQIAIFESAMPPMVIAGVLATSAGLAPRLVSAMVGYGILVSFATLPAIHWLITQTG